MLENINNKIKDNYEVLIIGAGPAGLAGAMTLGRLRRTVLICDDNQPRNKPSLHMNNFPGYDGFSPSEWRIKVNNELNKYPSIQLHTERVIKIDNFGSEFIAELKSGSKIRVKKILLAYGIKDKLPNIQGIEKLWGHTVAHCPYCHGFEFQEKPLGLLGDGDHTIHLLSLLLGLSRDIILFTNGVSTLNKEEKKKINDQGIKIIETPIERLESNSTNLENVVLKNNENIKRTALFITPKFPITRSSNIGEEIGCKINEMGFYEVDMFCQTSVQNVFAVGDIAGHKGQSIINSAASGSMAASRIVSELLMKKANF